MGALRRALLCRHDVHVTVEKSQWQRIIEADPEHSHRYAQRFRDLEAKGFDIHGEARLADALLARGSVVLDAGCGAGRVGGYLHRAGHRVTGMDQDPVLIEAAEQDFPGPAWTVGDLAETPFPRAPFDLVVCAGNVMAFLAESTRTTVLSRFAGALHDGGSRVVIAFGADRGYPFPQFLDDAASCGLTPSVLLSTWDLRPFAADSSFLVAVLQPAAAGSSS